MQVSNQILESYTNIKSLDQLNNLREIKNHTVLDEGFDCLLDALANYTKIESINLSLSSALYSAETISKDEEETIQRLQELLNNLPTSNVKSLKLNLQWDQNVNNLFRGYALFKLLVTILNKEWLGLEEFEFCNFVPIYAADYETSDVFIVIMEFLRKLPHPEKLKKLNLDLTELATYNFRENILDIWKTSVDFYQQVPPLKYELRDLLASLKYLSNLTEFGFEGDFVSLIVQDEIGAWIKNHPCLETVTVAYNSTSANLLAFTDIVMNKNLRTVTLGSEDMFLTTMPDGVDINEQSGFYMQGYVDKETQVINFFAMINKNLGLRSLSLNFSLYDLFHEQDAISTNNIFESESGQALIRQRVFLPLFQNKTLKSLSLYFDAKLFPSENFQFFAEQNQNIVELKILYASQSNDIFIDIGMNVREFNTTNINLENRILSPFKNIVRENDIVQQADIYCEKLITDNTPNEALDLIKRADIYIFFNLLPSLLDITLNRCFSPEMTGLQNQLIHSIISTLHPNRNIGVNNSRKIISYLDAQDLESLFLATGGLFFNRSSVQDLIASIHSRKRKAIVNYQEDTEQEDIEQDEGRLNKCARYNK